MYKADDLLQSRLGHACRHSAHRSVSQLMCSMARLEVVDQAVKTMLVSSLREAYLQAEIEQG